MIATEPSLEIAATTAWGVATTTDRMGAITPTMAWGGVITVEILIMMACADRTVGAIEKSHSVAAGDTMARIVPAEEDMMVSRGMDVGRG